MQPVRQPSAYHALKPYRCLSKAQCLCYPFPAHPELVLFCSGTKVASIHVKTDVAEVVKIMFHFFLVSHTFCFEGPVPYQTRRRMKESLVGWGLSSHINMQKILAIAAAFFGGTRED